MHPYQAMELLLSGTAPENLTVDGSVKISEASLGTLPSGLTIRGDFTVLSDALIRLPAGLTVKGNLDLRDCPNLATLADGIVVGQSLILTGTKIATLPDRLSVGKHWTLDKCENLTEWPETHQNIVGSLSLLGCKNLVSLPKTMTIGDHLFLNDCVKLTTLPISLIVEGELELTGCESLRSLPKHLKVGDDIYAGGTCITETGLLNDKPINSARQARPYLTQIAAIALEGDNLDMTDIHSECGTIHCIAGWARTLFPNQIREDHELTDAVNLLGMEAASHFFDDQEDGRTFLEKFR